MKTTCGWMAGALTMLLLAIAGAVSAQTTIYPSDQLTSGQTVSGSVGLNSWKNYKITASSSHTQLQVNLTNLSADVDLYVRKNYSPTATAYTCRPYKSGTTSESCTIALSGGATWYIAVQGYQAGSFSIKATLSGSAVTTLTSGQQVSGSVGLNSWKNYQINASSSNTQLKVDMTGLSADVDLYVQKGSLPTLTSYACRPYKSGTTSESCTVSNSGSGVWYISAYGYQAGSFNLKATLSSGGAFVFPFQDRSNVWQVCQGYNTPNISHTGSLINSFDFAYGTNNLGGSTGTGCWGNTSGSENKTVIAPAAGTIAWIGSTAPDITCLKLQAPVSNGYGSNIASVKLGHMKSGTGRVTSGSVSKGSNIGTLCGPTGCASVGGYAHVHMSAYTSIDCSGTSIPFGTIFGSGYNFSSNGSYYQWRGTTIPVQ